MELSLTEEQRMLVESARAFVEQELYPYEDEIERTDQVRPELAQPVSYTHLTLPTTPYV